MSKPPSGWFSDPEGEGIDWAVSSLSYGQVRPEEKPFDVLQPGQGYFTPCDAKWRGWSCTLKEGHPGEHMGGGTGGRCYARWTSAWDVGDLDRGPDAGY